MGKSDAKKIQSVRGMPDALPDVKETCSDILLTASLVLDQYGYREVGLPYLESTDLFKRLVGEATDIVEKEMYTFDDRNGDSVSLRPEGTAGCVRMAVQNGLIHNQVQRFWYSGAMFRHERPQKGRYRQFEQIGAECFGMPGPDIDVEMLLLTRRLWLELGIEDELRLEINSLGSAEARLDYHAALMEYLSRYENHLDEDSKRRLRTNPLRILDSKVPETQRLLVDAPNISKYLDAESRRDFDQLRKMLDLMEVKYVVNPRLVRGLDYYNKTVFEWVTESLGSQGAVCAGGRYDSLVEQLGGKPTPAVGFAMGVDRVALMLLDKGTYTRNISVYVVSDAGVARGVALETAEILRGFLPRHRVVVYCGEGKLKAQMKKADASGARLAVIMEDIDVEKRTAVVKRMASGEQERVPIEELFERCERYLLDDSDSE